MTLAEQIDKLGATALEIKAARDRYLACLLELKGEYENAGQADDKRAATYKWSLTRIAYALSEPQEGGPTE